MPRSGTSNFLKFTMYFLYPNSNLKRASLRSGLALSVTLIVALSSLPSLGSLIAGGRESTGPHSEVSAPSPAQSQSDADPSVVEDDPLAFEQLAIPTSTGGQVTFYGGMITISVLITFMIALGIGWARALKSLQRLEAIRSQLAIWGRNRLASVDKLEPVPVQGPESLGWNMVLRQFLSDSPSRDSVAATLNELDSLDSQALVEDLPEGFAVAASDGSIALVNTSLKVLLQEFCGSGDTTDSQVSLELPSDPSCAATCDSEDEIVQDIANQLASLAADHQLLSQRPSVDVINGEGPAAGRTLRIARYPRFHRDSKEFNGTIWVIRDITQQKLAEKMRDEFLDSATHELRTPLANIKAYAETLALADVLAVEQQKEFCNTINAEATRLARLIDDLLSISSMEVGSLSVNCQRTEVDRLLKDVVSRTRPAMEKKQQKFHVLIDEKIPEMKLDKDKFATILVNLIGNASKYTPEGGNVTLRARVVESSLLIDVEDTGVGISEKELPRVFEKFFRSSDPRVQSENGTGLGLSLTQELVRLHGGTMTVRSQLNQGSCFTIRLPL